MNREPGSAVRTILVVLGSSWLGFALTILRVLVLPGKLGDSGMGMVTLGVSFTNFFGIFISLGISTYLVRAVARDRLLLDDYISNALVLRIGLGVLILAILTGLAGLLGYAPQTQEVIFIIGVSMVLYSISNVFESGLQSIGQMGWRAVAAAIGQGTATCVGVGMLLMGADPVTYSLSLPLGAAVQFGIVLSYYFRHRPLRLRLNRGVARLLLIGGLPLFMWGFLQTAYMQIDATVLSLFANEHVVGWYGVASQITSLLILIPSAVSAVALPRLCEMFTKDRDRFDASASRSMLTMLLVMLPLGAGLAVSASDALRILPYPPVFMNAVPVLTLLALAVPVTSILMMLATLAIAIGQEKQWLKISAFAVCIFPPLYVALIWWFQTKMANGAVGAGLADLVGESALVLWAWLVLPHELRRVEAPRQAFQIGLITLSMVGVVVLLQHFDVSLFIYVPAGGLTYFAGVWLARLVTPNDLRLVGGSLLRRRRAEAVSQSTT